MTLDPQARAAVYFAPPQDHPLARLGAWLLGHDLHSGHALPLPVLPGIAAPVVAAVTAAPAVYGFHATLRAPMALRTGFGLGEMTAVLERLARHAPAVPVPPLRLAAMGPWLTLMLADPAPALTALQHDLLRVTEPLRAPLTAAQRARRRPERLDAVERALLERWGYPHVLERFTFHMTLAGPFADLGLQQRYQAALAPLVAPHLVSVPRIERLSLCLQPSPGARFAEVAAVSLA